MGAHEWDGTAPTLDAATTLEPCSSHGCSHKAEAVQRVVVELSQAKLSLFLSHRS